MAEKVWEEMSSYHSKIPQEQVWSRNVSTGNQAYNSFVTWNFWLSWIFC